MRKNLIFTDKEADFLKALVKNNVSFMIVGLSAATLQGAIVVTQDIDLWFKKLPDPQLNKVLKKFGASYLSPSITHPPLFVGENLEMFDIVVHMHGLDEFKKEIKNAINVPLGKTNVKVLSLERIIKSKESLQREKDRLVLPVLKQTLQTLKAIKNKKLK